jgi:NADPH-dependent 2,4-dienoyl-CoA reductase/sulfur reductase-like enzyme
MRHFDVIIIGGGIAGTTAAETFRAVPSDASVLIVSDEPHRLYSRVLLTNAVKGKIPDEKLFIKPANFYDDRRIETMFSRSVLVVSPKRQTVFLDGGEELAWVKLVVAVGGKSRDLGIEGDHLPGVMQFQTYDDALKARKVLQSGAELVVIGSGRIALEFVSIAIDKKIKCTLLNRGPNFWASVLGPKIAGLAEAALAKQGIVVRNNVKVSAIEGTHQASAVRLSTGERIPCTAVGVGVGVEVPKEPFEALGFGDGIKTNEYLETEHHNVWAAGDCADFTDPMIGGFRHIIGNWTNALAQGRHVGRALLGERKVFDVLTQNTITYIPGFSLIMFGESRMRPGVTRVEELDLLTGRAVEHHVFEGRDIGIILANASDLRGVAMAQIGQPHLSTSLLNVFPVK